MNKNKLRVFSTEEKSKIVIEVLREENPISVLASKHGVRACPQTKIKV